MGLEPTTFGSEVRRAIHYATKPYAKTFSLNLFKYSSVNLKLLITRLALAVLSTTQNRFWLRSQMLLGLHMFLHFHPPSHYRLLFGFGYHLA